MKIKLLPFVILISFQNSFPQWSTSPYADSGLYVCPGFEPGIITYSDGSTLILGALSGSTYAQKLDPYGYYLWSSPIRLFSRGESDVGSEYKQWYCSDGDGGAITFWYDYEGAEIGPGDPGFYCNNAVYVQRVDKNGNVMWGNGVKVNEVETGKKIARIVNDDSGGCVIAWLERDFECTGSSNLSNLKIARIGKQGVVIWEKNIATGTTPSQLGLGALLRVKDNYFFQTNLGTYVLGQNGEFLYDSPIQGLGRLIVYSDSLIFNIKSTGIITQDSLGKNYVQNNVAKMTIDLDTLWSKFFWLRSGLTHFSYHPIFISNFDNIYFGYTLYDTEDEGTYVYKLGANIGEWPIPTKVSDFVWLPTFGPTGDEGFLVGSPTTYHTWRYDKDGTPIWNKPMQMVSDSQNAYFGNFESDNNGGMIAAYWSTLGGIYVQHSGRNGELGVITSIKEITKTTPETFVLYQNYPNPFNPATTIKFSIIEQSKVRISIIDILGQNISDLVNEEMNSGTYEIQWNASKYSSGVYFYSLYINNKLVSTRKLLLNK